jgi:hypothetical protein
VPNRFTPPCAAGCAEYPKKKASIAPANHSKYNLVDIEENATLTSGCNAGRKQ